MTNGSHQGGERGGGDDDDKDGGNGGPGGRGGRPHLSEKKFLRSLVVVDPGGRGGRQHPSEKKFLRMLAVVDVPVPDENMDDGGGPEFSGRGRQGSQDKTAQWWRQGWDEPPRHPHWPARAEG
jgi:hypothetical protein